MSSHHGRGAVCGEELMTVAGSRPGTALRLSVHSPHSGHDGLVRLEQLAHDPGVGWYVQKSFDLDRDVLTTLATHLRKADCLLAGTGNPTPVSAHNHPLRIGPALPCAAEEQTREG